MIETWVNYMQGVQSTSILFDKSPVKNYNRYFIWINYMNKMSCHGVLQDGSGYH
jgi:hypothetical protein